MLRCVISKDWWDAWRKYVGGNTHHHQQQHSSSSTLNSLGQQQQQAQGTQVVYTSSSSSSSGSSNQPLANPEPPSIDNYVVLQVNRSMKQLTRSLVFTYKVSAPKLPSLSTFQFLLISFCFFNYFFFFLSLFVCLSPEDERDGPASAGHDDWMARRSCVARRILGHTGMVLRWSPYHTQRHRH